MYLTAEFILQQYTQSGKKHLFITGDRQVGKTTVFNKILPLLNPQGVPLHGLTSYIVPKKAVMLRDNITGKAAEVGIYCPEKATVGKNMIPHSNGFFTVGIPAMETALANNAQWVTIDELGFLESGEKGFQQAVVKVLENKRVMAVIRKQHKNTVPFLDSLLQREDAFVIDLDEYCKKEE